MFVRLGVWQLERAEDKQALLDLYNARQLSSPIALDDALAMPDPRFQPVHLEGTYWRDRQFLLAHQVVQHQPGFHVLTPLQTRDGLVVLVNRGWVPHNGDYQNLPYLPLTDATGPQQVTGFLTPPPGIGMRLGDAAMFPGFPRVVQYVDMDQVSDALEVTVVPFLVKLSPEADHGFLREWTVVPFSPDKHRGYALQWFSFAGALIIIVGVLLWQQSRARRARA